MKKKLVVLGRGTAGSQAMAHFAYWLSDYELEWHFDSNIKTQSVGEGSTLSLPKSMFQTMAFSHSDLDKVDGTLKTGVAKEGWGKTGKYFFHDFPPPAVSYHFNAVKLQDYILDRLQNKVKIVDHNVKSSDIDADYIVDCSGVPETMDDFDVAKYVSVNAVHVNQCFWDYPRFQYTLAIARPYGWVFGIPLKNRCSIGYMYNKDINSLEEIKEDILNVINQYKLTPSDTTNTFSFKSYCRKENFTDRIAYNGNASFFLEPLEATSIGAMDLIQRNVCDILRGRKLPSHSNQVYHMFLNQVERFVMMHYFAGSPFNTPFWNYAQERGARCMEDVRTDLKFKEMWENTKDLTSINEKYWLIDGKFDEYGVWWTGSFFQNIRGLNIETEIANIFA